MLFCPFCGTLLLLDRSEVAMRYMCTTCSYRLPVRSILTKTTTFEKSHKRLVVADDEDELLKGAQTCATKCESGNACMGDKAYFVQHQLRSADEAATTFYKCTTCGFRWRVD
jgi:DNA-directed RNA polymerase III subunit RPC11